MEEKKYIVLDDEVKSSRPINKPNGSHLNQTEKVKLSFDDLKNFFKNMMYYILHDKFGIIHLGTYHIVFYFAFGAEKDEGSKEFNFRTIAIRYRVDHEFNSNEFCLYCTEVQSYDDYGPYYDIFDGADYLLYGCDTDEILKDTKNIIEEKRKKRFINAKELTIPREGNEMCDLNRYHEKHIKILRGRFP